MELLFYLIDARVAGKYGKMNPKQIDKP